MLAALRLVVEQRQECSKIQDVCSKGGEIGAEQLEELEILETLEKQQPLQREVIR